MCLFVCCSRVLSGVSSKAFERTESRRPPYGDRTETRYVVEGRVRPIQTMVGTLRAIMSKDVRSGRGNTVAQKIQKIHDRCLPLSSILLAPTATDRPASDDHRDQQKVG